MMVNPGSAEESVWVKNAATPPGTPFVPRFNGHKKEPLGDVRYVTAASQQLAKDKAIRPHHGNTASRRAICGVGPGICYR